ncbi:MAG: hypothetical protein ACKOA8_03195, partial [Deltaproteobacteria bacterium]
MKILIIAILFSGFCTTLSAGAEARAALENQAAAATAATIQQLRDRIRNNNEQIDQLNPVNDKAKIDKLKEENLQLEQQILANQISELQNQMAANQLNQGSGGGGKSGGGDSGGGSPGGGSP